LSSTEQDELGFIKHVLSIFLQAAWPSWESAAPTISSVTSWFPWALALRYSLTQGL
jgi:hypothetical protein